MKFWQLTAYNMKNIFLEKLYTKCGRETIPRIFSKKSKLSNPWINSLKFYTVCFYCMPSWGLWKYIEIKLQTTCFYLKWSIFKKNKKRLEYSPSLIFYMIFEEKYFCYSITGQISSPGCLYFMRYWTICILRLFLTRLWHYKCCNQLYLSNQSSHFSTSPKRQDKNFNILKLTERPRNMFDFDLVIHFIGLGVAQFFYF